MIVFFPHKWETKFYCWVTFLDMSVIVGQIKSHRKSGLIVLKLLFFLVWLIFLFSIYFYVYLKSIMVFPIGVYAAQGRRCWLVFFLSHHPNSEQST